MKDKMTYRDGVKRGRLQIIRNLKKHYDDSYFSPPVSIAYSSIGVQIPEITLRSYFRELAKARGK